MILLKQSKNYLQTNDIPVSIIKNFAACYCEKLASIFNECLKKVSDFNENCRN